MHTEPTTYKRKKDLQSGLNEMSQNGLRPMKEFDYNIDYKNIMFTPNDTRYRIGRGEQGVLLVRPYTDDICKHWRFKTPEEASSVINKDTSYVSYI